jgi:hypothetical protein
MQNPVSANFEKLVADPWRKQVGFSPEIETAHEQLFTEGVTDSLCANVLNDWLKKYQPCLFGRIAAKMGLIRYCILNESDLQGPDTAIRSKIQSHRTEWTREGFEGKKSGFIIAVVSRTIANALPNEDMMECARRICSLYLLADVLPDQVYLDEIWLEKPGNRRTTWEWYVGANYFCAQGDKRWWQDHRIPGGMVFSMNSVGHLVKSTKLATAMSQLDKLMEEPEDGGIPSKVDSLETALEFAMRTIHLASESVSGKATSLVTLPNDLSQLPVRKCPAELPEFLRDKNFCNYSGYYDTDYTIPSEFFLAAVERPYEIELHNLDFTYLFDRSPENPAFETMGTGRRVRGKKRKASKVSVASTRKRIKSSAKSVRISSHPRLLQALKD